VLYRSSQAIAASIADTEAPGSSAKPTLL